MRLKLADNYVVIIETRSQLPKRASATTNPMKLAETETGYDRETRARRHVRIRRAKQFLRPLPRKATIHRWPVLKWFAKTARKRPHLWSFRTREVSIALYLGFVIALLPLFGIQFLLAIGAALTLRANLPVIMGAQLLTNPATFFLIYPAIGALGSQLIKLVGLEPMDSVVGHSVYSLVVGGVVVGITIAFAFDMAYRFFIAQTQKRPINLKRILKK
ncbi:MAG: DUF2062 domain-containing protein [Opitutaceae bacterium]|nr:DUF2062 domain-containing protein [Opitutaceae bacterium]